MAPLNRALVAGLGGVIVVGLAILAWPEPATAPIGRPPSGGERPSAVRRDPRPRPSVDLAPEEAEVPAPEDARDVGGEPGRGAPGGDGGPEEPDTEEARSERAAVLAEIEGLAERAAACDRVDDEVVEALDRSARTLRALEAATGPGAARAIHQVRAVGENVEQALDDADCP